MLFGDQMEIRENERRLKAAEEMERKKKEKEAEDKKKRKDEEERQKMKEKAEKEMKQPKQITDGMTNTTQGNVVSVRLAFKINSTLLRESPTSARKGLLE